MKRSARRLTVPSIAVCLALGLAASAGASGASQSATARQYLSDGKQANSLLDSANTAMDQATTGAQLKAAVAPLLAATAVFDSKLLKQNWPTGVRPLIRQLVADDRRVAADFRTEETPSGYGDAAITARINADNKADGSIVKRIHSALGLGAAPEAAPPGIGSTIAVGLQGAPAQITLTALTDPAQGADSFTTPDAGDRFVGANFKISNASNGTVSGDTLIEADVVGSDGQVYTGEVQQLAGCTDFDDGSYTVAPGESESGCVTFQLPTAVTIARVQWRSTNDAEWTIAP